jgi:hypothetical protein
MARKRIAKPHHPYRKGGKPKQEAPTAPRPKRAQR